MVTYYCPFCWQTVPGHAVVCPNCGAAIQDDPADLVEKYIRALRHPEPMTRLRAAWQLGRMGQERAVQALVHVVTHRECDDPYLTSAAAQSLGLIGSQDAVPCLAELLADPQASFMARIQAAQALERIGGEQAMKALDKATYARSESVRAAARNALSATAATTEGGGAGHSVRGYPYGRTHR